jgi:hypothetical protein
MKNSINNLKKKINYYFMGIDFFVDYSLEMKQVSFVLSLLFKWIIISFRGFYETAKTF